MIFRDEAKERGKKTLVLFSVSTFDRNTVIGGAELEAIVFYFCIVINRKEYSEVSRPSNTLRQVCYA